MSLVILDGFDYEHAIGNTLISQLEKENATFSYFKLKEMNILPCRSCGSCGFKTPGECVFKDDMPTILRAVAKSSVLILLTPIRFGGYSSQLKKAMDRCMVVGLPLYFVKDGHMLHPMRYGQKSLLAIGLSEADIQGQEENFKTLVSRNGLNMQFPYNTLIFKPADQPSTIQREISNALKVVNQ